MTRSVFLGLDLGTTGVKLLMVAPDGEVLGRAHRPLALKTPRPAWAEQDPRDWWEAVLAVLSEVPGDFAVERIGLSGQMHTLVPLGADGQPVRDAILWCDQRTAAQCAGATAALGGEARVIAMTGNPIYPGFTLPKILWLRDHEPESFRRLKIALIAKDYVAFRLTGEIGSELSDASGSSMLDVAAGRWNLDLMRELDLDPAILPPLSPSEAARGRLTAELAARLGWRRVEVAAGGADNAVSALGLGLVEPGDCMISVGTSGTVVGVTAGRSPDPAGRLHYFRHVVGEARYHMGVMLSAAAALDQARERLAPGIPWPVLEAEAAQAPPGGDGLLFLPYLQGERTPHRDPDARGVLFGLSSLSDRPRILRAVMEGVAFGLRDSFELLKGLAEARRVLLVGGGAKNEVWRRILAACLHSPVTVPVIDEGGAYGAAMLAALGAGLPLAEVKAWARPGPATEPSPSDMERYDAIYGQFKALYRDLALRFKAVAAL